MTSKTPLIGLTGRRMTAAQIVDTAPSLAHLGGDWYYADYARAISAAGGLPVHIPLDADPAAVAERIDGLVLSGGADIDPSLYGRKKETDEPIQPERDAFELSLLARCMGRSIPVLGICRGLQLINVLAGGSLHQHVEGHARYDINPESTVHDIETVEQSTLREIYGPSRKVNSLHHQTVARVGRQLRVTAIHGKTVEGIEHTSLPVVSVQWHPEMLDQRDSDPVFRWIVDQSKATAARLK